MIPNRVGTDRAIIHNGASTQSQGSCASPRKLSTASKPVSRPAKMRIPRVLVVELQSMWAGSVGCTTALARFIFPFASCRDISGAHNLNFEADALRRSSL